MTKRDKYLRKNYGITEKQYNKQLKEQNHCCAFCGKHKSNSKRSLAVDHNHRSRRVRGIVCFRCNKYIIGRFNLESATKLYQYMLRYEGEVCLKTNDQ